MSLLSLVITVRPAEPLLAPPHLGRAVYALLMRWLDSYDAALARRWHDDDQVKPFTCSSLVGGRRAADGGRVLTPERDYWFRLTAFDPEVVAALKARAAHPPRAVDLDGLLLPVTAITADPTVHPWAGETTFGALSAPYLLARAEPPRRLILRFAAPTTFHQRGLNLPLPLPELVFGSLADRWNAFSPAAVSSEVRTFAAAALGLNGFRLRSRLVRHKAGGLQVGAIGQAAYTATRYDRYWLSVLALLADFAFYSGVGRGVTVGLGQVRRAQ